MNKEVMDTTFMNTEIMDKAVIDTDHGHCGQGYEVIG